MTDSIEILTPNSGFLMITRSIKDSPNDCDDDRLPKITSIIPFPVVGRYRNRPKVSFLALGVVENHRFAVGIVILYVIVPEI